MIAFSSCFCETSDIKQTIDSPGVSLDDVRAAVSRSNSGDTIIVPDGSATWSGQLVITKGVIIKAQTVGGVRITSNYSAPNTGNSFDERNWLIVYKPSSPSSNEPFRLSGFEFDFSKRCYGINLVNETATSINQIRIDHNKLTNTARPIQIKGTVYGVADNNEIRGDSALRVYGNNVTTWENLTFDFGTADNFYFEDNVVFHTGTATAAGAGGRYCLRYNTYTWERDTGLYPWFDAHGNQPTGNLAHQGAEIYENTVNAGAWGVGMFDHRGGKMLAYNNNAITSGSVSQKVREEYHDSLNPPASSPISGQPQHPSGSYYWGNRKNGRTIIYTDIGGTVDYGGDKGRVPQRDKEFWDEDPAFDGTSGIGIGLLANRPGTGVIGVGYWATDKKILYRWTSNNRWEEYYTPYTYPHPLRVI